MRGKVRIERGVSILPSRSRPACSRCPYHEAGVLGGKTSVPGRCAAARGKRARGILENSISLRGEGSATVRIRVPKMRAADGED